MKTVSCNNVAMHHVKGGISAWNFQAKRVSFYFPSISFLSGFPSAFPLILKQERSLALGVRWALWGVEGGRQKVEGEPGEKKGMERGG